MSEPAAAGAGTLSLNEVEAGQLNQLLQQAGFAMPPDGALQANGAAGEEVEGTGDTDSDDEDSQGGAAAAAANKGANVNYKSKPRRKATQKPVGSDQKRQAFSKRKRGIVLKAYQLYKLTDAKVFMFVVNDKGSSWAYASPSFGASLQPSHLRQMRELAGLPNTPKHVTEVMAHPKLDEADRMLDDRHVFLTMGSHNDAVHLTMGAVPEPLPRLPAFQPPAIPSTAMRASPQTNKRQHMSSADTTTGTTGTNASGPGPLARNVPKPEPRVSNARTAMDIELPQQVGVPNGVPPVAPSAAQAPVVTLPSPPIGKAAGPQGPGGPGGQGQGPAPGAASGAPSSGGPGPSLPGAGGTGPGGPVGGMGAGAGRVLPQQYRFQLQLGDGVGPQEEPGANGGEHGDTIITPSGNRLAASVGITLNGGAALLGAGAPQVRSDGPELSHTQHTSGSGTSEQAAQNVASNITAGGPNTQSSAYPLGGQMITDSEGNVYRIVVDVPPDMPIGLAPPGVPPSHAPPPPPPGLANMQSLPDPSNGLAALAAVAAAAGGQSSGGRDPGPPQAHHHPLTLSLGPPHPAHSHSHSHLHPHGHPHPGVPPMHGAPLHAHHHMGPPEIPGAAAFYNLALPAPHPHHTHPPPHPGYPGHGQYVVFQHGMPPQEDWSKQGQYKGGGS